MQFDYCIAVLRQKISTVWLCKETSNNKHDWTFLKYLNVLHHNRHKSSCKTIFLIYCKNITNFLVLVLGTYLATSIKENNHKFDVKLRWKEKLLGLSACKKQTPFLTSFLRYYKDNAYLLLWVLWECLIMSSINDSMNF